MDNDKIALSSVDGGRATYNASHDKNCNSIKFNDLSEEGIYTKDNRKAYITDDRSEPGTDSTFKYKPGMSPKSYRIFRLPWDLIKNSASFGAASCQFAVLICPNFIVNPSNAVFFDQELTPPPPEVHDNVAGSPWVHRKFIELNNNMKLILRGCYGKSSQFRSP